MNELFRDIRQAARALRRRPGFTMTAAITIALGVAATTALYSVVHATLLRPLPFDGADRLAIVWGVAGPERDIRGASPIEIADWRALSSVFDGMSLYDETSPTLSGLGTARQLEAETVEASYFELLEVQPVLGRTFSAAEEQAGGEAVVVIGYDLWRGQLGGDASVLGRTLTIDDRAFTIVGVMPEGFRGLSFDTEAWLPLVATAPAGAAPTLLTERGNRWLAAVGRLSRAVTPEAAQADLDRVAAALEQEYPQTNTDRGALLVPIRAYYLDATQQLLLVLLGAVLLLFLIAGVNVTNLQLVRASARTREVAVRFSLGGSRARIVRQLVAEGVVLALLGGGLGLLGATWGVQAMLPLVPDGVLPPYAEVGVNAPVAVIAVALAALCGMVSAAVPALRATAHDPGRDVVTGTRATAGGGLRGRMGLQHLLVAGEVALALVVLVGAGLVTRSFDEQRRIAPGFDSDDVVVARVGLPPAAYDADARVAFVERLLAELRASPGMASPAVVSAAPLRGFTSAAILRREGYEDDRIRFYRHSVSPNYFETLGIPIVRGRGFGAADGVSDAGVAVIGETTARRLWPDADPIGRRLVLGGDLATVIGVARDVRMRGITVNPNDPTDDPDVYFAYAQVPSSSFDVVVRAAGDPGSALSAVRATVARLDPNLAVYAAEPLAVALAAQTATDRFGSFLLALFGGLALLLAAVGVYGVMAFFVGTRAREIAIRMAIGADPANVRRLVLRRGLTIVVMGIVAGTGAALLASRFLTALLYGVRPTDPPTYGVVALVLLVVAMIANAIPALRATRIAPQVTLRSE